MGLQLLKALKDRSLQQGEAPAKCKQALYNFVMEGDTAWQHWLNLTDPDVKRKNKLANLKVRGKFEG